MLRFLKWISEEKNWWQAAELDAVCQQYGLQPCDQWFPDLECPHQRYEINVGVLRSANRQHDKEKEEREKENEKKQNVEPIDEGQPCRKITK